jgi:AP2-like factor (euAP2 lineage)
MTRVPDTLNDVIVDRMDRDLLDAHAWHVEQTKGAYGMVVRRTDTGTRVGLARTIMGLTEDDPRCVIYLDGNQCNCRRSNLKIVSRAEAAQITASRKGSSSRFRGVAWNKRRRKWTAQVGGPGSRFGRVHLGYFDDEIEAAERASAARAMLMPHALPDPALEDLNTY